MFRCFENMLGFKSRSFLLAINVVVNVVNFSKRKIQRLSEFSFSGNFHRCLSFKLYAGISVEQNYQKSKFVNCCNLYLKRWKEKFWLVMRLVSSKKNRFIEFATFFIRPKKFWLFKSEFRFFPVCDSFCLQKELPPFSKTALFFFSFPMLKIKMNEGIEHERDKSFGKHPKNKQLILNEL